MPFPATAPVEQLNRCHADYSLYEPHWTLLSAMNEGGILLRGMADQVLTRRPKEPQEAYQARLDGFTCQNIFGSVIGWYQTKLFETEPRVTNVPGKDPFWSGFLANCNRGRKSFMHFLRDALGHGLIYGRAYVLRDLPVPDPQAPPPTNRLEQERQGLLDPYLCLYDPSTAINWDEDEYGNLLWICFRVRSRRQESLLAAPKEYDRWYYFDRSDFAVYEAEVDQQQSSTALTQYLVGTGGEKAEAKLLRTGKHAESEFNRVPVERLIIPDQYWLGNRVYLQILDHLNSTNGLKWALQQSNLAMPIITGTQVNNLQLGETYYLNFPEPEAKFYWSEPAGTSIEQSATRCESLREEAYRTMHLQAQGRSSSATPAVQSGYAKELEMAPAEDVLNAMGALMQSFAQNIIDSVQDMRGEQRVIQISWPDFDWKSVEHEIALCESAQSLGIVSPTLQKAMHKRVAAAYLRNDDPDLLPIVEKEIDAAPTPVEMDQKQRELEQQQIQASFNTVLGRNLGKSLA